MFSNHRSTNKAIALVVFLSALILYMLTLAPTASFWDPGEFIAVAHGLEVNHPPGAPLFELLGRLFSMFMPMSYVAVSVNFISALASALTIMLLYLITVRLVREFKGHPDDYTLIDKIGMYGGAIVGALAFAVSDSFWFNAVEAEVYASSMFFTAIVVWLALKWSENHDKPNNERWLLLIAYMFGLALGVHLLNLLAIFFVAIIIYFKKRDFELLSFCIAGILAVVSFLLIYPFTIQMLPEFLREINAASYGLIGPVVFLILIVGVLVAAIYYTHKHNHRLANVVLLSYALILIGYSSYALIFIRSAANPPIDENNPETVESFIKYLKREQYGQTPLLKGRDYDETIGDISQEESFFPRRYSREPSHLQQYGQYSSDWDYFLNYQVNHMYIRYFNWNFIGRDSDIQDANWQAGFAKSEYPNNPAHNSYFYLPFLLGLIGFFYHYQRDWRRALAVSVLFIMTGLAIIVFLNQTPMQPRERDYAYVGSFFAFAIWIGMGGVGLVDMVKEYLKSNQLLAYAVIGLCFVGVPLQMCYQNYDDHDRSDRYVASDYAYNLLQSVDQNGILFTNGDNDTFPLWYAQEVEGVRTDVRVVCLSLLNTDWYIKQLRDQWSHESAPLPITLTDAEIEKITNNRYLHQPDTVSIPVNKQLLKSAFSGANEYREAIGVKPDTAVDVYRQSVDFHMPVDSLDDAVTWFYKGRPAGKGEDGKPRYFTRVQDDVIMNILKNNQWLRPVFFANTVATSSQLGLQHYFRFQGTAFRVVPKRHENISTFGWINPSIQANTYSKFRMRDWSKPGNYLDNNIRRILGNYRYGITELANSYMKENKPDSASKWLKWGAKNLPFNTDYGDNNQPIILYAYSFATVGDSTEAAGIADKTKDVELNKLKTYAQRYINMQDQAAQINDEIKKARAQANISQQKKLQERVQSFINRRDNITRDLQGAISNLIIIQRIYYMTGHTTKADALSNEVSSITKGQIVDFPKNEKDSKAAVDRYKL